MREQRSPETPTGTATVDDVIKLKIYLTDMSTLGELAEARRGFFAGDYPTSTLVEVAALAQPGLLVEVEAIAVQRDDG